MNTLGKSASLAASIAVLTVAFATPAAANDVTAGDALFKGRWTDATDTLCAKTLASAAPARARIKSLGATGSIYAVIDQTPDGNFTCTNNLAVPEDTLYEMTVARYNYNTSSWDIVDTVQFYT